MVMLKIDTKTVIGILIVVSNNNAIPVVPPVIKLFGIINIATAKAYIVLSK